MFRRSNRLVLVSILAVMLVGAATAVCHFVPFARDSAETRAEEKSTSSDEEPGNWKRMHDLDWKWLQGEQLTEAETAELRQLYRKRRPVVGNHLTDSDKRAIARLDKVQQMPPTDYPDYHPIPADDKKWLEVRLVHSGAKRHFTHSPRFGFMRMQYFENERGASTAHRAIDRVELVSLLTSSEPNAYVIDDMATPRIAKMAKRRSLDAFESAALGATQRGEYLVYSPVVPNRMFGALRADASCVRCHDDKREGDLLGAFTYWLKQPVEEIKP